MFRAEHMGLSALSPDMLRRLNLCCAVLPAAAPAVLLRGLQCAYGLCALLKSRCSDTERFHNANEAFLCPGVDGLPSQWQSVASLVNCRPLSAVQLCCTGVSTANAILPGKQ